MRNRILQTFSDSSPAEFAKFSALLTLQPIERGSILCTARSRTDNVYFVDTGIVSLVAMTRAGRSLDVAIVGAEGVAGLADALGQHPLPYAWVVQISGTAFRAPTAVVRDHILSCTTLHELLMAYSQSILHQLTQSAICNRFHTSVQRLARWLLLTADRAGTLELDLTHELMAEMVGAPRSAVTQAASRLREAGIIGYHRGVLTIHHPKRLQKIACECFDSLTQLLEAEPPAK
jgi:CRP-like cAMP-binding protein